MSNGNGHSSQNGILRLKYRLDLDLMLMPQIVALLNISHPYLEVDLR